MCIFPLPKSSQRAGYTFPGVEETTPPTVQSQQLQQHYATENAIYTPKSPPYTYICMFAFFYTPHFMWMQMKTLHLLDLDTVI